MVALVHPSARRSAEPNPSRILAAADDLAAVVSGHPSFRQSVAREQQLFVEPPHAQNHRLWAISEALRRLCRRRRRAVDQVRRG